MKKLLFPIKFGLCLALVSCGDNQSANVSGSQKDSLPSNVVLVDSAQSTTLDSAGNIETNTENTGSSAPEQKGSGENPAGGNVINHSVPNQAYLDSIKAEKLKNKFK